MILHSRASIYMGESVVVQPVSLASRWGTSILGGGPQAVSLICWWSLGGRGRCGRRCGLSHLHADLRSHTGERERERERERESANEGGREGETKRQGDRI